MFVFVLCVLECVHVCVCVSECACIMREIKDLFLFLSSTQTLNNRQKKKTENVYSPPTSWHPLRFVESTGGLTDWTRRPAPAGLGRCRCRTAVLGWGWVLPGYWELTRSRCWNCPENVAAASPETSDLGTTGGGGREECEAGFPTNDRDGWWWW